MDHPSGGAVLGAAINHYVYVGVQPMTLGSPLRYRVRYSVVDDGQTVEEIKHPAVKAALQYYGIDSPLLITCFGDLPGGAGLGSSSSFCVGILKALQEHFGLPATDSPLDLASEAISFERHVIPETVGFQDQTFAAVGGLNYITFGKDGTKIQRLHPSVERIKELEDSLILVYVGNNRSAHTMAQKQVSAIPRNHDVMENLVALAKAGRDVLLNETYPLSLLGGMLDKAWRAKVLLCPEVTTPAINTLYARGRSLGALGGKLCGAGNGGFILFFVTPTKRTMFKLHIDAPCIEFKISTTGAKSVALVPNTTTALEG